MEIKEWFASGCEYKKGVELYSKVPYNSHLLTLFSRSETAYNREKLKQELKKHIHLTLVPEKQETPSVSVYKELREPLQKKTSGSRPISYYPPELHEVYHDRVSSFYKACSLKAQLNSLAEDKAEEALVLQMEIFRLWEENDRCSDILNHYETTKRILPYKLQEDLSGMNLPELFRERQKLYQNISKRRKTLDSLEKKYKELEEGKKKILLFNSLNKKKEELQIMILKKDNLTEKINHASK